MKKPFANIGILLLFVIILPPLFFTSYEIGNLYQNEQMIDSIYTSQLESVIFSINQYSDDVVSGWANKLESNLQKPSSDIDSVTRSFLNNNASVQVIFFADSLDVKKLLVKDTLNTIDEPELKAEKILLKNKDVAYRIIQYIDAGYRKIQPIDIDLPNYSLFLFAFRDSSGETRLCGLLVNTQSFIRENLGPKIQAVAQNKFYFSVFDVANGAEVYSNEIYETTDKNIEHKKELWLMPDYELGIQLKGETIEDLVNKRTRFNLWLILIMDAIMILAAWFVYRGVRQQMKLAQIKSEFVSNVSHEIRTPLSVINMYSETLEMDRIKNEEKKKEYYKVINTEANRLSGIVNKILNFSNIDSGKREYKFDAADLNEALEQIIDTYQHHFKNKGFTCNFYPSEKLPELRMDKEAFTDAVINLIDNAIKYSNEKKQIDITTGQKNQYVFVEIKDYGIGIDSKDQKLIFDKFYRVTKGNLAHKAKGSGIGLSIVKHIVEAHNGKIDLVSKTAEGSSFILRFPINKS